jgi:hypothetical protein
MYWEVTQSMLQGDDAIVRKPRLKDALLQRPPFRFLHDVITEVKSDDNLHGYNMLHDGPGQG